MRYADIIVTIRLAEQPETDDLARRAQAVAGRANPARTYDALVYTALPAFRSPHGVEPPLGAPAQIGPCPLASVESLRLNWDRYQSYLAQFLVDRKTPDDMRSRLFEAMSPGLERLFSEVVEPGQPIRVWWSAESIELEDFPWELVAYMNKGPQEIERFSFVRGLPPTTPVSLVPIDQGVPLRLAILAEPATNPKQLQDQLGVIPGLKIVALSGSPREMLQQMANGSFELLHVVCDGIVSLAYDGILYFHGASSPLLTAEELAGALRPTRTVFLGFSSTYVLNPDVVQISGHDVPSAYRAFAYLANAALPMPTIMAPLAPAQYVAAMNFWKTFYSRLTETLSIEQAAAGARKQANLPVALHLRHPHEQQFRRRSGLGLEAAAGDVSSTPSELGAELDISQRLVQRLENIATRSSRSVKGMDDFLREERAHQERLSNQLAPWRE